MANKIQFEITVDDKGAVKTFRQIGDAAKQTGTDSQKAFAGASDSIQRNWLAMTAAVGAAMLGVHKTIELLGHGAKEKQVEEAFHNVARSYGQDADKIIDAMHRATAGTINGSDLMQKAIKGMTQDLSGADMVKIAEMARVAARTTGEDVSAMFDQISDAIANQTPRALRRLGLVSKEELKVLEGAVAAGVEGVNLLDLAFIQATKSGEAMGGMVKNESEYFQQLKAVGKEMYDTLSQGALSYAIALSKLGQGDMALAGLSPAGMGAGRQSDPKASEQSTSSEQRKKAILDKIKSDTKAAKDREEAIKNAPKLAAERKKAAEDEAAVYQEMFEGAKEAYTYTFKMAAEAAKAEDDRIKQTLAGIESAEKAEQEKSEMLGQMAMVDQKIAEGTAKDKADAYRTMYGDMKGDTQQYYDFQLSALGKERDNYEKLTGDKVTSDKWYLNQKKKLDQDLALSSNKFFKGIEIGYDRMLDDQMTWAKGGLAIFNSFAKSGQSTISNVLFDGIKGDLKSFEDYWDSFFDSLLRTFTDTVAEMATQKLADAAVKPLVNFVGGAAGAAGSAAWDWLSEIDWFHAGSQMVGNQLADQRGNLSSEELLAVLKRGEIVIPPGISDDVRGGNYSSLAAWMGSSFSAPDWLSMLYTGISANVGKTPLLRDEQGNIASIDPYAHVKRAIDSLFRYPGDITKELVAQKISNSGFAYLGGNGAPYLLVGTGKEGRDYAFRANLETIDTFSKTFSGVSTISIPSQISRQLNMMMSGGSGGGSDPFGGISAGAGVPGGSGIGSRMFSAYIGTALQGLMSGQISAYGLISPALRAVMEAAQENYGMETGSGRYSTAGTILGGLVAALTQNPVFGTLAAMGISGYGNYSYTKEKADILGMNPDIADALAGGYGAGGYGGESSMGGSGIPGGYGWRYGGIARGPESGYTARLHGTELVVSQKKDVPVKIADSGGGSDLPPVQINLNVDGKTLAKVLYKQTRAGVKTIHDRGLTNV